MVAGDCCSSLAFDSGFASHAKIHDDPANAALKADRPNPNVLGVGDVVTIPDPTPGEHQAATDAAHRYQLRRPRVRLRLVLHDEAGNALADKPYTLVVDGGEPIEGTSAADGLIEQRVPTTARRATLTLRMQEGDDIEGWELPIELGSLPHESSVEGAKARLMNLGFDCGGESATLDDPTKAAIRGFRSKHGLPDSDALDDHVRNRLRTEHEGA